MSLPRLIWRFVIPVVLILLVVVTTMGAVCHHHDGANAANCTLCHMAIEPPAPTAVVWDLVLPTAAAVIQNNTFVSRSVEREISPRAPPASSGLEFPAQVHPA